MNVEDTAMRPYVVIISGAPGSGRTTLGWELSRRLHVPFISRDDIKTGLHVTHRSDDPQEVWRFAQVALDTPTEVSLRRYRARAEAGGRHPAHNDLHFAVQMESGAKDVSVYRLDLDVPTVRVDGTNGWSPSLAEIADFVDTHR